MSNPSGLLLVSYNSPYLFLFLSFSKISYLYIYIHPDRYIRLFFTRNWVNTAAPIFLNFSPLTILAASDARQPKVDTRVGIPALPLSTLAKYFNEPSRLHHRACARCVHVEWKGIIFAQQSRFISPNHRLESVYCIIGYYVARIIAYATFTDIILIDSNGRENRQR